LRENRQNVKVLIEFPAKHRITAAICCEKWKNCARARLRLYAWTTPKEAGAHGKINFSSDMRESFLQPDLVYDIITAKTRAFFTKNAIFGNIFLK
jgi:hypothetical protein